MQGQNADQAEIAKFDEDASSWWDPAGPFAPLHAINPLRLDYIERHAGRLRGRRVLDVGCGGGLLAEAMAGHGAAVTAIDLAEQSLEVARLHALSSGVEIDYRQASAEAMAQRHPGGFDIVTCLELLEHVPDPAAVVEACAALVRPGGAVFFSTINRNARAWLFAIIGAERILRLLPAGTHDAKAFIRPAELARWARQSGLALNDLTGLHYNPVTQQYFLADDTRVNYLAHCTRTRPE